MSDDAKRVREVPLPTDDGLATHHALLYEDGDIGIVGENGGGVVIDQSQADALAGALETWVVPDKPLESRILAALPGDPETYITVFEVNDRLDDVSPEEVAAALARLAEQGEIYRPRQYHVARIQEVTD